MNKLICPSCKNPTSILIGGECQECCYISQPTNQILKCAKCFKVLGRYRKFDLYGEPNLIDKVFCDVCK